MNILQVGLNNPYQYKFNINNQHKYNIEKASIGELYPQNVSIQSGDAFSFTGHVPKVYSSNAKNAIIGLAKQGVTCLCCGKKMIDPNVVAALDAKKMFNGKAEDILNTLKEFNSYMKPLEKRVFNLLVSLNKQYPDKNLPQLLQMKTKSIESKLIDKQSQVFGEIYDYSVQHFSPQKMQELNKIFNISYDEIYGRVPKTTFSRKKFISLIYKYSRDLEIEHQAKLLEIAEKLPSSQDQFEAFIIKYSRKNNRNIALRLIEKSVASIEHIKPRAEGGGNSIYNYAVECSHDNWTRGCNSMITQIQQNPDMPKNAQKQVNQIIRLVNAGKSGVNSTYVIKLKEALYRASGGIIDLNISKLKLDLAPKEIY